MALHQANQRSDSFWGRLRHRSTSPLPPTPAVNKGPFQRTLSLQVASQNAPPGYVSQYVSAYNLKWADLRKWLVKERFKNMPELDRILVQEMDCLEDKFYFPVPELLTQADADAINGLRKTDTSKTDKLIHRRGHTPDPDLED